MVCEDKRRIIAYLWYLNALLSIAYVIVAICAAANQKDVSARRLCRNDPTLGGMGAFT